MTITADWKPSRIPRWCGLSLVAVICTLALGAAVAPQLGAKGGSSPNDGYVLSSDGNLCVQDQYGNQYNLVEDPVHRSLTGTMTNVQGCSSTSWPAVGSYVRLTPNGVTIVEITCANPDPFGCVSIFKLKGTWPEAEWYYEFGYGAQAFIYAPCGSSPSAISGPGLGTQP